MSEPGTIEHFCDWAAELVLDTGETWEVEGWQREFIGAVLGGKPAAWLVVPEGNGKTTMMAGLGLYALDPEGWGTPAPMVVVAAAAREQAEWLYLQAEAFVQSTPGMNRRLRCLPGLRRITLSGTPRNRDPGRLQVYAADDRTADGAIFTLAIIDELHNHRDLRLWRRWRGKLQKRGGQIVAISTAGEPGSEFEETRSRLRREAQKASDGPFVLAEDEVMVLHDWALRDRAEMHDMNAVAAANPRAAITPELLELKHADKSMTDEHWLRFTCNVPTRIEGSGVLPEQWDACAEPALEGKPGAWCVGGIDLGFTGDCTGLVILQWESFERRPVVWYRILEPPVDQNDIVDELCAGQQEWQPEFWVFDPSLSGAQIAQMLDQGTHPRQGNVSFDFREHSQANTPMALAAARLDEAIRNGWLRHDGTAALRTHVLNAVKKDTGGGRWRFERPAVRAKIDGTRLAIDGLTALSMAHSVAVAEHEQPAAKPFVLLAD